MCQGLCPKKHDEISEIDRNSNSDNNGGSEPRLKPHAHVVLYTIIDSMLSSSSSSSSSISKE